MLTWIYMVVAVLMLLSGSLLGQSATTLNNAKLAVKQLQAFQLAEGGIDAALTQWATQDFTASTCADLAATLQPDNAPTPVAGGSYSLVSTEMIDDLCRIQVLGAMGLQQCVEARISPQSLAFPGQLVGWNSVVVGYNATVEGTVAIGARERINGSLPYAFQGGSFWMRSRLYADDGGPGRLVISQTANPYQLIRVRGLALSGRNLTLPSRQARWRVKMGQTLGVDEDQVLDQIETREDAVFQEFMEAANEKVVVPERLDCSQALVVPAHTTTELHASVQCFSSVTVKTKGKLIVPRRAKIFVKSPPSQSNRPSVSIGSHAKMHAQNALGDPIAGGFELLVNDTRPVYLRAKSDVAGTVIAPTSTISMGYMSDTEAFDELGGIGDEFGGDEEPPPPDEGGAPPDPVDEITKVSRIVGDRILVRAGAAVHLGVPEAPPDDLDAGVVKLWQNPVVSTCSP